MASCLEISLALLRKCRKLDYLIALFHNLLNPKPPFCIAVATILGEIIGVRRDEIETEIESEGKKVAEKTKREVF